MFYGPHAPSFALNFHQICFTSIFHPEKMVLSKKFATSAHIRIFLAFRIYINFYSNLKIEPATPDLHLNFLKCTQCKKSCFLLFFALGNSDLFYVWSILTGKKSPEPIFGLRVHGLFLTKLSKSVFKSKISSLICPYQPGENDSFFYRCCVLRMPVFYVESQFYVVLFAS